MELTERPWIIVLAAIALLNGMAEQLRAQSITPARDGTGTVISRDGNRYVITGGQRSRDGANLFQSFERLGLSAGEIATFMAQPGIENILGRVTGGQASVIDGLLQVSGGQANLYLLNPAGILFGANARLDIPGSFTATTASGIGMGDRTFNAVGSNNYADLVGTPDSFAFTLSQPGAIVNGGNLAVNPGERLALIGGTVINTGTLSAPGGTITVAAVPGANRVRISQDGALLSLELEQANGIWDSAINPIPFTPRSLPALLTGGTLPIATGLSVDGNGTVRLTSTGNVIPTTAATAVVSGGVDVSWVSEASSSARSQINSQINPQINVVGDRLFLLNAQLDASGATGGTIRIGGDYQGRGTLPNAQQTVVDANTTLRADAIANLAAQDTSGHGGRIIVWSDDATYFYGHLSARGAAGAGRPSNGGFAEISGRNTLNFRGTADLSAPNGTLGTLLLDPTTLTIIDATTGLGDQDNNLAIDSIIIGSDVDTVNNTVSWGQIEALGSAANISLEATGQITIADITGVAGGGLTVNNQVNLSLSTGSLSLISSNGSILFADTNDTIQTQGGTLRFQAQQPGNSITLGNLITNGGAVSILASQQISTGTINTSVSPLAAIEPRNGGDVSLTASGSGTSLGITTGDILTSSTVGNGGAVSLLSQSIGTTLSNTVQTGAIDSHAENGGSAGAVSAIATGGNSVATVVGDINASATGAGNGGGVTVVATSTLAGSSAQLQTGDINSSAVDGSGGAVAVTSYDGSNTTRNPLQIGSINTRSLTGAGGNITIGDPDGLGIGDGEVLLTGDRTFNAGTGTLTFQRVSINAGVNNLTLIADEVNFLDFATDSANPANSSTILGTGNLVIQPFSTNQAIALGGGDFGGGGTLNLGTAELALLQNGFRAITIGRSGGGPIRLGANVTFSDPTLLLGRAIDTRGGLLSATDNASLTLSGSNAITLGRVRTGGTAFTANSAGRLRVDGAIATQGGAITLSGSRIDANAILDSSNANGTGGAINLTATGGNLNTRTLNSAGINGGAITARAADRLTTGSINAQGGDRGIGGAVRLTAQNLIRVRGLLRDRNGVRASISTAGGQGGGPITMQHGGNGRTPFVVGNSRRNGTAGSLTTGEDTLAAPPPLSIRDRFQQGDIQILTTPPVPPKSPNCRTQCNPNIDRPPTGYSPARTGPLPITPLPAFDSPTTTDIALVPTNPPVVGTPAGSGGNPGPDGTTPSTPVAYFRSPSLPATLFQLRDLNDVRTTLLDIQQAVAVRTALIYVGFVPVELPTELSFEQREALATQDFEDYFRQSRETGADLVPQFRPQDSDRLELLIITGNGEPIRYRVPDVTRADVQRVADRLRTEVTSPARLQSTSYLAPSQQLYRWLIAPLEADLQAREIHNLSFVMDAGLRAVPLAALHDGQQFIIERYSVNLMPSISLTDTSYVDLRNLQVLAMGASQFSNLPPLPAVPTEVATITPQLWRGKAFLNRDFTLENLRLQRQERGYGIIHLATHAEFSPGRTENSFIQLWNQKLRLDQMRQLGLNNPPVELLVLSACRTALGNSEAELGFAGLALQAGVRSALASLWYVTDEGTLAFMTEFYRQLREAPIKAEALRRTQLALLHGDVVVEGNMLRNARGESIALPPELQKDGTFSLAHPFYWSAFTLVGSPW